MDALSAQQSHVAGSTSEPGRKPPPLIEAEAGSSEGWSATRCTAEAFSAPAPRWEVLKSVVEGVVALLIEEAAGAGPHEAILVATVWLALAALLRTV